MSAKIAFINVSWLFLCLWLSMVISCFLHILSKLVSKTKLPKFGKKLKVRGSPWHFSETPPKLGIAPEVGEHNVPILKSIGYSDAQIKELKDREVI